MTYVIFPRLKQFLQRIGLNQIWARYPFVAAAFLLAGTELHAAPFVSGFDPLWGVPGTQITITGSGFSSATQVEFGEDRPGDFQIVSDGEILAVVPQNGLTAQIKVTAVNQEDYSSDPFYVSPRIESFAPTRGTSSTTVTINGENFLPGGTWVLFGSLVSPDVEVTALTQVRARVPAGATNSIVYVYTGAGWATSVVEFIASPAPLISSFNPENGLPGQNVPVVINGANFLSTTNVSFGGTNTTFEVTAETQIRTTVPAGAGTGKIRVGTTYGEAFSSVDFVVGPTINYFQPLAANVGDWIVVNGNNFNGLTNVTINGVQVVEGNQVAQTQLSLRVPTGATSGKIVIGTVLGVATSALDFTVGPYIQSFTPVSGPIGSSVRIDGAAFDENTLVFFGTNQSFNVNSPAPSIINAVVPAGATNAPISVVSTVGDTSTTNTTIRSFLVTSGEPVIDRVEPGHGVRGAPIKLSGANFNGITSVTFGGVPAGFQPAADPANLTVYVPPGALTGHIIVSNSFGAATSPEVFYAAPWVTGFFPPEAVADTVVEISGTNFLGATDIYFGGERGQLWIVEEELIYALVTHNARSGPVQIDTPGGSFITTTNFSVRPRIIGFEPTIGPINTFVVIEGTSFFGVTNVSFNGTSASFTNISSEVLHTRVPEGATSGHIEVGTPDGTVTSPTEFTVTMRTDLDVSETTSTNFVETGTSLFYVSTVTNRGPSDVTGVMLTNTFPVSVELLSADSTQGGCVIEETTVYCDIGVILTNSAVSVTIDAALLVTGIYTNTVTAGSIEGQTTPVNNTARSVVVAASIADRTLDFQLLSDTNGVVLWKASQVPFQLQNIGELGSTNVDWSDVLTIPVQVNGTNRVTNGIQLPQEYFRLVY